MIPDVRGYVGSSESEIWVACDAAGTVMGFMGLSGPKIDALFLAPEFQGRGAGLGADGGRERAERGGAAVLRGVRVRGRGAVVSVVARADAGWRAIVSRRGLGAAGAESVLSFRY